LATAVDDVRFPDCGRGVTWLFFILVGISIVMLIGLTLEKPPPRDKEFHDDWP
jgi:hypothetical protein